jgi:hypothetical protein
LTGRQRPARPDQKRSTAQRVAEQLIVSACVLLPEDVRDERYREWAVIDPGTPLVIAASLTILIRRAESRGGQLSR